VSARSAVRAGVLGMAIALVLPGAGAAAPQDPSAADVAAARQVFEKNLDAIRRKDRDAYLSCYLHSPALVRTGPAGYILGYDEVERTTGSDWPAVFDAQDLRLTPIRPGVVYGTYRYRVRYVDDQGRDDEQTGLSERLFVSTPEGWKIAASTAFGAPPDTAPPPRALVGATLVDGTGSAPVIDAVVTLRDGKIECAGSREACPVPKDAGVVDLAGSWIAPGLVDAHIHLSQTGWADGRPDAMDVRDTHPYEETEKTNREHPERFLRADLCSGVTAAFDVGGYPWTIARSAAAENDTRLPRLAAAGPLLSTWDFWLNLPGERQFIYLSTVEAAREGVRYLHSRGAAAVKVWLIDTGERPKTELATVVGAVGDEAAKLGLPLIVHATELETAKIALRSGARLLVHSVGDAPVDGEFLRLAKDRGTIYCPTLTVRSGYTRLFEAAAAGKAPEIDDPNGCVDAGTRAKLEETAALAGKLPEAWAASKERRAARTRAQQETEAANLRAVRDAGIPIALGTDAGNPLTLHGPAVYAEAEAMQAAGLTAAQVLVAATRDAALAMGRGKDLGTIEPGKLADLIVLGADPTADIRNLRQLRYVVRGGEMRAQEELRALPGKK
jgi:imidazolonepropionase-like amidohydrolase